MSFQRPWPSDGATLNISSFLRDFLMRSYQNHKSSKFLKQREEETHNSQISKGPVGWDERELSKETTNSETNIPFPPNDSLSSSSYTIP